MESIEKLIRNIPDFPSPGIMFRDITTLLKDPDGLQISVDAIAEAFKNTDFDLVLGPESRGFIFGVPLAYKLKKGFVPARKVGKLPAETARISYSLEYGNAEIEIHKDAIKPGAKVVIVDDLLATGGTAKAVADLVTQLGAEVVGMAFLIELAPLGGRKVLSDYKNVISIITY